MDGGGPSDLLERDYGVVYQSLTSYRSLLKRCGLSRQKPAKVYQSRSELKVMAFEETLEKKLIDTAQAAPNTVILAQDEASLYLQATLQLVWHTCGQMPVVKVDPGRAVVHFYGALNLHSGQEFAMPSPVMNAETTALYLQQLLLAYPDQPILLLWDRAPWHKGAPIRDLLKANPRLELLAFPPGAPDLNPQEHVWKATRAAISHNHQVPRLPQLAAQFLHYLNHTTFPTSLLALHGYNTICPMFT